MLNVMLVTTSALAIGVLVSARTWQHSRPLVAYLVVVIACNLAQLAGPAGGPSPAGFVIQELVATALRYWLLVDVAERLFGPLPGALRCARLIVLGVLIGTAALVAWGLLAPAGPRATFRALALANAGTGLGLLALRRLALHFYLPAHPVQRLAMTWFGSYLVVRGLLMGAATEWSASLRMLAVILSSAAWAVWAIALAWVAWSARRWSLPEAIPR